MRRIAHLSLSLGLAFTTWMAAGCVATIAQWAAPKKTANREAPANLKALEQDFWTALHGSKFDQIPRLLESYNRLYVQNPRHPLVAARLGFLHVWRLAENRRFDTVRASVIEDATLCRKFFAEASRLEPDEARYQGFHAACTMAEADLHRDEKLLRRGYFMMKDAIQAWPEFNLFTGGYVLSHLPVDSSQFAEALEWQWDTLDICSGQTTDRQNPTYAQFMKDEVRTGEKRVCWNSTIAPHNFEGFFLNMGDMLVKKGDVPVAKKIYAMAKLSKTYQQWPHRKLLEERIANAERHVKFFRTPYPREVFTNDPHLMFHSKVACMACHQGP